jgi:hypothetical protein
VRAGGTGEYDPAAGEFRLSRLGHPPVAVPVRHLWIDDTEYTVWQADPFESR